MTSIISLSLRAYPWTRRLPAFAGALAVLFLVAAAPAASARPMPESFADLAERLLPSVVNISTTHVVSGGHQPGVEIPQLPPGSPFEELFRDYFERERPGQQMQQQATSLGSGFIIDPDGYVVTNNHVIAEAVEIEVILQDNTRLKAKLVGHDPKTDIALLKVEAEGKLPAVAWGNSDKARVGDWVMAIGNPFALGGTVTAGIVSARARNINVGPYDDFIQTDASINRGNSGGPLFNMAGEVIGINTAIFSPSGGSIGIGFAVPSAIAAPVIGQLREFGRTRRGWLGVRIQAVSGEIADSLGMAKPSGALVGGLIDNTAKGKIERGDVILSIDGVVVEDMSQLPRMVASIPPGKKVRLGIFRKGKKQEVVVTLGEREIAEQARAEQAERSDEAGQKAESAASASLGMVLAPLTDETRVQFGLGDEVRGVIIADVESGGPAAEKRLRAGDVIVEVGQEEVATPAAVAARIEAARKAGRKSVFMLVERQGNPRFVVVPLEGE